MSDTWDRIHDAALTRHEDGGAELARLVIDADDVFDALKAENDRLREALREIERHLTNLQPHIPQSCKPGHEGFIDNYVDPALEVARAAIQENTND